MKKIIYCLLIILFIIIIIPKDNDEMRIRVIANSNSNYDQSVKYEIVSIVKSEINPNDAKEKIIKKFPKIKKEINSFCEKRGIKCTVEIRKEHFPKKSLNGKIIPEGYYESLVVEIGEGQGKNWWTLLYPEYFNITYEDIESGEVEVKSYFFEKIKKLFK